MIQPKPDADAIARCLALRSKGVSLGPGGLVHLLMAKAVAREARLSSFVSDLMADIGAAKDQLNKLRKREGLPPIPINTFAGANMSQDEILST